ncbi:TMEM161B-AS1 isoform 12 [Pongo abelii]|uniref:TMEM161B-AS1 isoform 12 n=1 Tax=Pongo abelii TaxID=9601 RepID=A0A2J8UX13_PONAB|nr:TMEM161B-AS1 isoform 12 [Pongo abelii]
MMKSFLRPTTRSRCWCHASTACRTSNWEPNSDQQGGIVWLIGSDRNLGRKQPHTKDNCKKKRRHGEEEGIVVTVEAENGVM